MPVCSELNFASSSFFDIDEKWSSLWSRSSAQMCRWLVLREQEDKQLPEPCMWWYSGQCRVGVVDPQPCGDISLRWHGWQLHKSPARVNASLNLFLRYWAPDQYGKVVWPIALREKANPVKLHSLLLPPYAMHNYATDFSSNASQVIRWNQLVNEPPVRSCIKMAQEWNTYGWEEAF